MSEDRYARYGALTGVVAVVALLVGFGTIGSADIPELNAPAVDWSEFYADNANQIQLGFTIVGIGLFFFIWFLGSLRAAIAVAEGGEGRLASIAFGGGLVAAGFVLVAGAAALAASFRAGEVEPVLTQALNDMSVLVAAPAAGAFTAMFAATAIAGYRYRPFPAPVAGFSALAAIGQPLAYASGFTDGGAFAGDGVLGLWVPVVTFALAVLTLSVALYRRPIPEPAG